MSLEHLLLIGTCRPTAVQVSAPLLCPTFLWLDPLHAQGSTQNPPVFSVDLPNDPMLVGLVLCAQGAMSGLCSSTTLCLYCPTDGLRFTISP